MRFSQGALALLAGVACSVGIACNGADPRTIGPPFSMDVPVDRFQLDNGLQVATSPNHTAPIVTALMAFRAGASVEGADLNGYSHLFEHMMFQGSEQVPDPRDFRARLDALGAESNATTSVDQVTYYFSVVPSSLEAGLQLFAGALRTPALAATELEKEKQVVLGEFDLDESDPDFLRHRTALRALFGADATRLDPLGSRSVVEAVTRDQLQAMHQRYYVPNNALLVFSGDITTATAHSLAERYFGDWKRADDPFVGDPPPAPEPVARNQYLVSSADVTLTNIELLWPGPSAELSRRDELTGDLLSSMTFQTDNLFRSLVDQAVIFSAGLNLDTYARAGSIRVELQVIPGQERPALARLNNVLRLFSGSDAFPASELEAAQAREFQSARALGTRPGSVADVLAGQWAIGLHEPPLGFLQDYYGIDHLAFRPFARKYLNLSQPHVVVLQASPDVIANQGLDAAWLQGAAP